ncbi:MAG: nucleoside hydrolase [Bacilli bacterium]
MRKIWLDTDIGGDIDDALTLLLLMSYENVEIVGVSTVFENTVARAKIAKKLLEMGNRNEVKVYAGIGKPIKATKVHNNKIDLKGLPKTYIPELFDDVIIEKTPAVEALRDALLTSDNDITVVTIGALTNLASLITKYPEAAKKIKEVYIMGAAVRLNLNEFNITCDPEAADIVFSSDLNKKVVTLDVTFKCELKEEHIAKLKKCQSKVVKTVLAMNKLWGAAMILHDPLTLAEAMGEKFVKFTPGLLKVELEGYYSRGKCINLTDFNWKHKPCSNFLISSDVENIKFINDYVNKIYQFDIKLMGAKIIK